jgi:hypothetical protein
MECRDVREMADWFLADELLTETNHEILAASLSQRARSTTLKASWPRSRCTVAIAVRLSCCVTTALATPASAKILNLHPNTLRSRMKKLRIQRPSHDIS